jgi:hypothetical protein
MRSKPRSGRAASWILLAVVVLALPALFVYRDSLPLSRIIAEPAPPALSLENTYTQLRDWTEKHSYVPMRDYLDPACREHVLDLLVAMDELLAANTAAQEAIKRACPDIDAGRFDISAVADDLGLFSRQARLVAMRQDEGQGIVTVELAGHVSAELAFEKYQDRWVYAPEWAGPQLVELVRDAAAAVERFTLVISSRAQTEEDIHSEFVIRVIPRLRRIVAHGHGAAQED